VYSGNRNAMGSCETPKYGVKSGEHIANAPRRVVCDVCSRRKCLQSGALKDQVITLGKGALKSRAQRAYHRDVENVQRRAVQRDPGYAMLQAQMDSFVFAWHICPQESPEREKRLVFYQRP